jgi:hypothetical protein
VIESLSQVKYEDLHELVVSYASAFQQWKAKTSFRRVQTVAQAFPAWWILKGPAGFRSTEDAMVFRGLLLGYLTAQAAATE